MSRWYNDDPYYISPEEERALEERAREDEAARLADLAIAKSLEGKLCSDCPPPEFPTAPTRCLPCPRRAFPTGDQHG